MLKALLRLWKRTFEGLCAALIFLLVPLKFGAAWDFPGRDSGLLYRLLYTPQQIKPCLCRLLGGVGQLGFAAAWGGSGGGD